LFGINNLSRRSIALIDRHNNAIAPRKKQGLCLVRDGRRFRFGYLEVHDKQAFIRSDALDVPVTTLSLRRGTSTKIIIGRVVFVLQPL
jgi:hypothetical protein